MIEHAHQTLSLDFILNAVRYEYNSHLQPSEPRRALSGYEKFASDSRFLRRKGVGLYWLSSNMGS